MVTPKEERVAPQGRLQLLLWCDTHRSTRDGQSMLSRGPPRPHILALLADDLGAYDTSIHNPNSPTPEIASLASDGLRLDRHYVYRYCSPSRRSFLTSRLPTAITTVQPDGAKLCSDFLPLATELLSEKLAAVGYLCHFIVPPQELKPMQVSPRALLDPGPCAACCFLGQGTSRLPDD